MPTQTLSKPDESEYAEYYHKYIGPVAEQDALGMLSSQLKALDPLSSLDDARALHRYAPDKWSVKEVVGHISDAERVFAYRMLRIARGDQTPLAGFDQQQYVESAGFDRMSIQTLVEGFRATRAATLALTAEIASDDWMRTGTASGFPVSARALVYIITGHVAHHVRILREQYGVAL